MSKIVAGILVVLIVIFSALLAYIFFRGENTSLQSQREVMPTDRPSPTVKDRLSDPELSTIRYDGTRFVPRVSGFITKTNTASVTFINNSSRPLAFVRDESVTTSAQLQIDPLDPGETRTVEIEVGVYYFVDRDNPRSKGFINVRKE